MEVPSRLATVRLGSMLLPRSLASYERGLAWVRRPMAERSCRGHTLPVQPAAPWQGEAVAAARLGEHQPNASCSQVVADWESAAVLLELAARPWGLGVVGWVVVHRRLEIAEYCLLNSTPVRET